MVRLALGEVFRPFLQLAACADAIWFQSRFFFTQNFSKIGIHAEDFRGAGGVAEQFMQDCQIHRAAGAESRFVRFAGFIAVEKTVFRRSADRRCQFAVLVFNQTAVEKKFARSFHHRIGGVPQEFQVAGELVVIVKMLAEPTRCLVPQRGKRGVNDWLGVAPNGRLMMRHPAVTAIHLTGNLMASHRQFLDETEHRLGAFGKIGDLGRPVIHLQIHVERGHAVPRGCAALVPESHQIHRLPTGTRTGNHQIAAKLKI